MRVVFALLMCFVVASNAQDTQAEQDYYIDDDQEYFDANTTEASSLATAASEAEEGKAFIEKMPQESPEAAVEDEPPKCLKDCTGFPQGKDATNAEMQCEFILGVTENEGCVNDCSEEEFQRQFSTMREFCEDTADSWDGACLADCPNAPGSKKGSAFSDDMTDSDICTFVLGLESGDSCLQNCKENDFTEINAMRDECAQDDGDEDDEEGENEEPVAHASAVTSAVMIGGFTMQSFIKAARAASTRRLQEHPCEVEPSWCANNLHRKDDGSPHQNCQAWEKDCPCTCKAPDSEPSAAADAGASSPGPDVAAEIARQHELEVKQKFVGPATTTAATATTTATAPSEHAAEAAFVSALAHTLLVKRDEVDIINIYDRPIEVTDDETGAVVATRSGIQIEFGVGFRAGEEQEQRLVAEKLRSMSLGCMYMFSGRIHCVGDDHKSQAGSGGGGVRGLQASAERPQSLQTETEDPQHKAVANIFESGASAAEQHEIDLLDELRFTFSSKLRKFGVAIPPEFSVLDVFQPQIVVFGPPQAQGQGGVRTSMGMGVVHHGAGAGGQEESDQVAVAAAAIMLTLLAVAGLAAAFVLNKRRSKAMAAGRWNEGMNRRFEEAKRTTTSFSPEVYDRDSPIMSPGGSNMDDIDVDLDEIDQDDPASL